MLRFHVPVDENVVFENVRTNKFNIKFFIHFEIIIYLLKYRSS